MSSLDNDRSICNAIRASRNFRAGVCSVAFNRSASVCASTYSR